MKVLCIMSHTVPTDDKGHFDRYEAGRVYELEDPEPGKFRAAGGASEVETGRPGDGEKKKTTATRSPRSKK